MTQAIKVGIFATVALLVLMYFVIRIEDLNPFAPDQQVVEAVFDTVAGLDDKAPVRIAGVRVGRVDGIRLEGRRARVRLLLEQPVPLTAGSEAHISNLGLLGDKYIELMLGPEGAPELAAGEPLVGVTPPSFDDAMAKLGDIGDSIQNVTDSLADPAGGGSLARLLDNLEATTAEIRSLVADNRQQLSGTIRNFESASGTLASELPVLAEKIATLVDSLTSVVSENRDQLAGSLGNIETLSASLQTSAENLNTITDRLARGEGTLGKLLTSDEMHDEIVDTLGSIEGGVDTLSDTLGRVGDLKLDLELGGFYLQDAEEYQGSLALQLDPGRGSNRLYKIALVENAVGDEFLKTQRVTETLPDGSTEVRTIETLTTEDEAVFSALLGVRLRNESRLWAGLIEDNFGVAIEYPVPTLDRRLWLDLEAFDFDREGDRDPHLRLTTRYFVNRNVYLMGGYDDPLESDRDSFFFGGGIRWNDDNLKYLLGSVPTGGF
ncbi:MAG: MlaD family protein [Acidobacteriota bacterium]